MTRTQLRIPAQPEAEEVPPAEIPIPAGPGGTPAATLTLYRGGIWTLTLKPEKKGSNNGTL